MGSRTLKRRQGLGEALLGPRGGAERFVPGGATRTQKTDALPAKPAAKPCKPTGEWTSGPRAACSDHPTSIVPMTTIGYPLSAPPPAVAPLAPAPAAEAPAPAAVEAPAPARDTPRTPSRFDLLQIARSLRRDLLAQKRRLRDAAQSERGELPSMILERAKQRAAECVFEDTVASHTPQSYKDMVRAKARSVRAELELARLTEHDAFDKERYKSFCARIKGSELEAWVLETFEAIDVDEDGEVSLLDFELLEGKEDGALAKLFTSLTSQKHKISIVEWVRFCADLWHVGGRVEISRRVRDACSMAWRSRHRREMTS